VQRKQQVGECWVCVIFFAQIVVSKRLHRVRKGVRGGRSPRKKKIWADIFSSVSGRHIFAGPTYFRDDIFPGPHDIRWFFGTWFFADGFLFPVKELGFWTNLGHWVRVLDVAGSYMYIVL
jgi:hypothetical protein